MAEGDERKEKTSYGRQMVGSLIAAVLIVLLAVAVVTARIGPGIETREREEELEEIQEEIEDLQDEREELRERE